MIFDWFKKNKIMKFLKSPIFWIFGFLLLYSWVGFAITQFSTNLKTANVDGGIAILLGIITTTIFLIDLVLNIIIKSIIPLRYFEYFIAGASLMYIYTLL